MGSLNNRDYTNANRVNRLQYLVSLSKVDLSAINANNVSLQLQVFVHCQFRIIFLFFMQTVVIINYFFCFYFKYSVSKI